MHSKNISQSYWNKVWQRYRKSFLNLFGMSIILFLVVIALGAPFLASSKPVYAKHEGKTYFPVLQDIWPLNYLKLYPELHNVNFIEWHRKGSTVRLPPIPYSPNDYNLSEILQSPSEKHLLGTDAEGRDVLSRLIYGTRISLSVGLVAVSIYTLIGILIGALSGFYGGKLDIFFSRIIEIVICFPTFFLILTLLALLGPSIYYVMLAIGLTGWTGIARLTRGEFLKLRNQDFVTACRAEGMSNRRIILKHILPNAVAPVLVSVSFGIASAILVESALSFLGFGVPPPLPSWGELLSQSRSYMRIAWWLTVFPGIAIFITITCFNLMGEGLRDALDPKLQQG